MNRHIFRKGDEMMLCRSKEKTDRKAPKTKGVSRVIRVSALFVATVFLIQLMVREPRGILALAEEILPETGVTQDADDTEEIVYEDEEGTEMVIPGEEGEPLSPDGEPLPMDTDGGTPEEPSEEPSGNPSDEPSGEEGEPLEDTEPDVTPNAVVPDITRNFFFTSPIRNYAENVKTMKVEKDKTYTMEEIFTAVQVTGKTGTALTNECVISVTYNDTFFQLEKETVEETEYFTAIKVIKNFDQPQTVDITYKDPDDGNAEKTLSLELKDSRYITDLNLLLDEQKILIDGEGYEESGSSVLYNPRKLYTLQASFIENPYQQFANYEDLIYTLPQGFVLPEDFNETHQTVDIDMGINGRLKGNEVLAGDTPGTVIVRWNRDNPKFANFIASSNAKFTLLLQGTLDPANGQVVFSTGKILNLEREDPDNAVVTKKVTINNASTSGSRRYVRYKVEVSSEGNTANLTLTDRMGSALIPPDASNVLVYFEGYNHMTSSGGSGEDVTYTFASDYQPTVSADPNNGFAVTIPKMDDYDVLVIEYDCNVDVNKIEKSGAATFEEMGNTAEVTGDAHPEDNVATAHVKDVDFNDIDKTAVSVKNISISGDPYAEIIWRVVTNRDRNIFLGGSDLTDTMGQMTLIQDVNNGNSDNVQKYAPIGLYAGDGISIEMVDKNGSTSTREVSWEAMGVDKSTAKTWTYHIPEEDDEPYQYTVTYTTRLSRTELLGQTSIPNSVSGKCGEDTAVVLVDKPGEGGIGVSKQATEILSDSVTWNVNVDIHKTKVDDTIKFSEGQPGDSGVFDNKNKYFLPRRWVTNKDPFTGEILYDSDGNPVGGKNYQETLQWVEIYGLKEGESVKAFYFIQVDNVGKDEELLESNGTRPSLTGVMTGAGPVRLDFSNSAVNTSNSVNKCFYMYFYKDAAQEHPGLNDPDTGEEYRKIQVRLHTTFSTEWAQQAQAACDASSYYQPKLFTHQNWVMVNGVAGTDSFNTQSVGVYKLNYVNGTSKTINAVKKEIMYKEDGVTPVLDANGEPRTIDVTYPVYRFSISVNGINTNEPIVIKDYYDTTLFKQFDFMSYDHEYNSISTVPTEDGDNYLDWLCPTFSGQSEINGWGAKASLGPLCQSVGYFKHRADYSQGDRSDTATKDAQGRMHLTCPEFEVSMDETEDGAVFTFNDPSKFTNDAGQLCNFYSVDYYLVPRDREAIAKLEKMAAEAPLNGPLKGQAVCSNTAVCRDVSDSAIFTYSPGKALKPVTKYFRNVDENETAQHPLLKFTIDVNPGKLTLNDGNAMDVIDSYSDSISVDYKSVTVDTDPPNAPVTFDFRHNTGTFTIPDNTRVVINYDARVIAEPKDENGNAVTGDVSFDNTVQVLGYGAEVKGKATVSITSGGSAPTPMLYLFKYSDSHMEKGLNGVSFTMYEAFDDKFFVAEDGTTLYRESGDKRLRYADG
ncbi:MAG: hypothetical protein IIY93_11105 [Clostridia bacterium]|nr:hypothetical protein [Clostridia bacterium]